MCSGDKSCRQKELRSTPGRDIQDEVAICCVLMPRDYRVSLTKASMPASGAIGVTFNPDGQGAARSSYCHDVPGLNHGRLGEVGCHEKRCLPGSVPVASAARLLRRRSGGTLTTRWMVPEASCSRPCGRSFCGSRS